MSVKPSKATQSTTVRKFRFIFVSTFVLSSVSWDILFGACLLQWLVDLGRAKAIFVSSWFWYCETNPLCIPLKSGDRWDFNQKWLAFHGEGEKAGNLRYLKALQLLWQSRMHRAHVSPGSSPVACCRRWELCFSLSPGVCHGIGSLPAEGEDVGPKVGSEQ